MKEKIRGIIFDLDGVLVSTDRCHFRAWKRLAEEEGIPFDETINQHLRGIGRMESLEILLKSGARKYTLAEKEELAARKNSYYVEMISQLTSRDLMPGVSETLAMLKQRGIRLAVGSSSRNAPLLLRCLQLEKTFDAVADGNMIARGKPDPEVFLLAASLLGLQPEECLVIEDADAGVRAALQGGMRVLGIGSAACCSGVTYSASSLETADFTMILSETKEESK